MEYTKALANLIEEFQKLPGIGPKSAQRMAFFVLKRSKDQVEKFSESLKEAKELIKYCQHCFNLTSQEICEICSSHKRESSTICVVPEVKDLVALERTREFNGLYHVLGGVISPLDGISADDLNIAELIKRIHQKLDEASQEELEIILAVSPSTEGEATILYIKKLLKDLVNSETVKITRLAYGLPVGADLDYADEVTLARALVGRQLC